MFCCTGWPFYEKSERKSNLFFFFLHKVNGQKYSLVHLVKARRGIFAIIVAFFCLSSKRERNNQTKKKKILYFLFFWLCFGSIFHFVRETREKKSLWLHLRIGLTLSKQLLSSQLCGRNKKANRQKLKAKGKKQKNLNWFFFFLLFTLSLFLSNLFCLWNCL